MGAYYPHQTYRVPRGAQERSHKYCLQGMYLILIYHDLTHCPCQRIENWYKEYLKKARKQALENPPPNTKPKHYLLDLTGKFKCRTRPYQLHQAFSVLHWQPPESPLRQELKKLWEDRNEEHVRVTLGPFLNEAAEFSSHRYGKLTFHMAVMRWKVSKLTAEELDNLRSWVDEQHKSKEQARTLPWAHTGGKGAFTQWVWVELIESTETICPANTHQVHAEFI